MTDEPNLNVNVELDLNGADRALDELTRKADAFGGALSGALKSATVDGRGLDDVLRTLGTRMVGIAVDAGTRPLNQLMSNSIAGLTGSLGRLLPFARGWRAGPDARLRRWRRGRRAVLFSDGRAAMSD
jgi:phage-related minor tail protein